MTPFELPHFCFIGKMGAGKTTAAELLVKEFGFIRLSFAGPLKVMCGTTDDRALLQRVGVGVRELHADAWVNLLLHDLRRREALAPEPGRFVIDDCRFPNEAHALALHGFRFVRVEALPMVRVDRLKQTGRLTDEAQLRHESEWALDDFTPHHTIANNGFSTELHTQVIDVLNKERY